MLASSNARMNPTANLNHEVGSLLLIQSKIQACSNSDLSE